MRQHALLLCASTLLLLLLCHQSTCTCTPSPGRSWEAARAAAKAAYQRNLELAGLIVRSDAPTVSAPDPAETAAVPIAHAADILVSTRPPALSPAGTSIASRVKERCRGVAKRLHGKHVTKGSGQTGGALPAAASECQSDQGVVAEVLPDASAKVPAAAAAVAEQQVAAPQLPTAVLLGDEGKPALMTDPDATTTTTQQQQEMEEQEERPSSWQYAWLIITHLAVFVLGRLTGCGNAAQQQRAVQQQEPSSALSNQEAGADAAAAKGCTTEAAAGGSGCVKEAAVAAGSRQPTAEKAAEGAVDAADQLLDSGQTNKAVQRQQVREEEDATSCSSNSSARFRPAGVAAAPAGDECQQPYPTSVQGRLNRTPYESSEPAPVAVQLTVSSAEAVAVSCTAAPDESVEASRGVSSSGSDAAQTHPRTLSSARVAKQAAERVRRRSGVGVLLQRRGRGQPNRVAGAAAGLKQQHRHPQYLQQQHRYLQHQLQEGEDTVRCGGSLYVPRSARMASQGGSGLHYRQLHTHQQLMVPHQQQQQQQPVQLVITAGPDTLHTLVVPALRVLQQLSAGVHSLSLLSASAVHHLQQLSSGVRCLTARLDRFMGWAEQQEQQQQLAAQQALGERSAHLGLALLLVAVAVAAVRVGRLWEVHQVCQAHSQLLPGSWHQRLTGTRAVTTAWQYTTCCVQQLGLYAAGLVMLYWLARASWRGLLSSAGSSRASSPSRFWQLDLVLFKGLVCSVVGAHVVHCLGAGWVPWLLLWLVWCCCQLLLQVRLRGAFTGMLLVACVSVVLPLCMAVLPFHARGILLQGWLLDALPLLRRLPNLNQLLLEPILS